METTVTRSVFRIFDYAKTLEFYVNWLGFKIDWEHKQDHTPVYMQVSLGSIVIHLSEHHGDCTPGGKILIENFIGLKAYQKQLLDKNYTFMRPGIETIPWNPDVYSMEVIDPFGNKLVFTGG